MIKQLRKTLGVKRLRYLGFNAHQLMQEYAAVLNRVKEELPFASDLAKADDIELQEITKNAARSMENLIEQLNDESSKNLSMCELLGLDKQLRSVWGSLKVETAKKVELKQCIELEKGKLKEIWDNPEYDDGIQEDTRCRITKLNDELKVRQESIDILKGRLTNQITSFKERIAKILNKDTS